MAQNTGGQNNMGQNSMGQNNKQQNTTGQGKQGAQAQQQQGSQQQSGSQSTYWRQQFQNEPYYQAGRQFGDYEPAYNTGEQGRAQYGNSGQSFEQVENNLRGDYENNTRGQAKAMKWDEGGKQACKAAWERAVSTEAGSTQSTDRDVQANAHSGSTNTNRQ
jgi:hypothetical protein